jgi:RNA polymerase sigma-70 factor, ECF subfamily
MGGSMLSGRMSVEEPPRLEQAMARFASGQDAALGEIYDLASPAVFTFLLRICRDRPLAEDLTQETFLRIHRARGLYRTGAAVMPWAYTIARRLFLDVARSRRSTAVVPVDAGSGSTDMYQQSRPENEVAESFRSAEDLLADRELAQAVDDALAKIPETQAAAFRLLKGEGLSVAETAAIMGTTKGAVKVRAHRAYEALRGMLGGELVGRSPGRKNRGGVT